MATLNITVNSTQAKAGIDDLTQHALSQAARIKNAFEDVFRTSFNTGGASEFIRKINELTGSIDKLNSALGSAASKMGTVSREFSDQAGKIDDVGKSSENAAKKVESSSSSMLLHTVKVTASYMAMRAAIKGVVEAITEGLEFENTMKLTSLAIGATKEETIKLEKEVRKLASTSIFAASEVTEAIKALALAGLNASEALTALPSVLNLAFIGEIDLEKAAATATNTMNAMRLTVEDLERIVDVFAATSIKTTASVQTLTEAMKYAAPIAGTLGYNIEEVSAMLGVLAQAGINGGQAGRVLQQAFVKAEIAAKEFGMEGAGLIEVLEEVNKRQLSTVEINKMFGLVALKGVLVLKDSIDAYRELTTELENTNGATAELVKNMETTTLSSLKMLKSAITEVYLSIYDVYKEDLANTLKETASFILSSKDSIVQFANELKAIFGILSDSFTVIKQVFSPIIEFIKQIIALSNELLKIIIGIAQILTTPVRWFTGEDIPKESDFRFWKQIDEDIKVATEEVKNHEEALKSVKAEYADLSESTLDSLNSIIMNWEGLSSTSLNDIFNWGGILELPSLNDIFGVAVAEAGDLEEKYVNIYNIKKLLLANGESEATVTKDINGLIGDQVSLLETIKRSMPEIVNDILEWKGIWSEISVLGFKFDTSFGRKSISDYLGFVSDAVTKEIDEIKSHNKEVKTDLDSMFESITDKQMVELAKQTQGYKDAVDQIGAETQRGQELTLKYVYNFVYEKKRIYAEDAKNQLDSLTSVMDGLGEAMAYSGSKIGSGMADATAASMDDIISTMKEKYAKILDLEQFQDEMILKNHDAALAIRIAKEKAFGDKLEAQASINMAKYAAAQNVAQYDSWYLKDQGSIESSVEINKKFQDRLISLTKTGTEARKELINKEFAQYADAAKKTGEDVGVVMKARDEALENEEKKVEKVYAKQAAAYAKAEEASRKYSEVIAEINSKISAFEGDTYASKMAKIEEQYLKYQKTLKGSSEELERWRTLAEKDVNDQAAEAIAQLNREISEFKGEEADGYAESIEKINNKYEQFAKKVKEGSAELETWKQLALETANLMSAGSGVYTPGTYSKWPRSEEDIQKEADTKLNAFRSMYKDLGETSSGYYAAEYELLKNQKEKYAAIVKDDDLVNQWYYNEKQKLRDKEILATDNFFDGMKVGYRKILEDQMTWAKAGKKVIEDFAKNGASAISTGLFDVITGQIDDLEDAWKSLWQSMLKTMTDIIGQMLMNDLLKLILGLSVSGGGLNINLNSSDESSGTSALGLASLAKSLWELPSTIASIPEKFMSGLEAVGEALGLVGSSATASSAAAAHAASSTTGAAVAMESLASSAGAAAEGNVYLAGTVDELVESYLAEQAATSAATSANIAGALTGAGIASIIAFGANILPGLIGGGNDDIDIMYELKKFEQGYTNITKETADLYKVMALNIDETMTKISDSGMVTYDWDKIDAWIASNQEFLNITVAEIEKLIAQQTDVGTKLVDAGVVLSQNTFLNEEAHAKATIDVAIEIAKDETMSVAQKMYQLGFIAKESGGWESEATMAMIAEFKNQGVAWQDINNALINYGATDADVYKRIYAEYHGDSVLTDLNTLTAALSADGVSEDVLKTIKYIYESNIPLDQMQALLEWAGLSSEEAARIVGQIDPSKQWKDLVIPVDAPDSIPVDYGSQEGRATGGPVAGGVPYIIGERGPELFVPQQSGHILSNDNMKKLMGIGIKGYADGTTDPLPGTPEWWEQNPPSDQDLNGSSSDTSTYKTLSEWLDDYNEKLKELLGTGNDLSDQLDELNKYYEEQNKYASELGASSEQIAQLQEDQQKAKEKILQDWLNEEIDYYNQMMGLNTDLGDTLKEISEHYDTAIAEATSAGATEEQLAEIRKAQMAVTEKALKDWLNDEIDYYNDAMGISTQYGNVLKEISDHYEKAIAEAKAAGATEEQLAEIRKAQMAVTEKATKDWAKSTMSSLMDVWESMLEWAQEIAGATEQQMALTKLMIYRAKQGFSAKGFEDILNIDGMNSDQVEEYIDKLAEYANAVISALQATYDALKTVREAIDQNIQDILNESKTSEQLANEYAQQIIAGWNALSGLSAEDMPEAIDDLREKIMKYYELQKKLIEDKYKAEEEKFKDEIEMIKKIRDKIQDLTYSSFNLALPSSKAATAADEYAALYAAAQTGDKDAIERYLNFINTYLQQAQDAYKSSEKYQEIYNQVMNDLKNLDTQQGKTIEELTEELNKLTEENTKKMQEELDALAKLTVDALKALGEKTDATMNDVVTQLKQIFDLLTAWVMYLYGGGNKTQSAANAGYADGGIASGPYSGYTATLHGTEAIIPLRSGSVPVVISGGGYDDPETKALLKQLVAQGKQRQRVTLALDNGAELSGYIRAEADTVRVNANSRSGNVNRRLYR